MMTPSVITTILRSIDKSHIITTNALVALGSALFTIISAYGFARWRIRSAPHIA